MVVEERFDWLAILASAAEMSDVIQCLKDLRVHMTLKEQAQKCQGRPNMDIESREESDSNKNM